MNTQKKKTTARVVSQTQIAPGIYDLWLETELAADARAGTFVALYPKDKSTLLPRPISVCEADRAAGRLRLVYRVAGAGTREFSGCRAGDTIALLGVLGNGYPVEQAAGRRLLLLGGGIGIPPLVETAKACAALETPPLSVTTAAGYRDGSLFLKEDLERYGRVFAATEDGSAGTRGTVMDVIEQAGLEADLLFACGPLPMLRAVKAYAERQDIPAYLSLEERMACGVGACLGCVCKTSRIDRHSHVHHARICTDGPVFEAGEVEI